MSKTKLSDNPVKAVTFFTAIACVLGLTVYVGVEITSIVFGNFWPSLEDRCSQIAGPQKGSVSEWTERYQQCLEEE